MVNSEIQIILIGLNRTQIKRLPKNIIGIERTENAKQLAEYYSLADVFINPSKSESFGLVTAESMACGTPVVVYNTTASPELVTPETGIIVAKDDIKAMYDAAIKITKDGKIKYSSNCIARVSEHYNKDIQYGKYIELYKNLMNSGN